MFGRRRKGVDVVVVAQDPVLVDGLDWADEAAVEDRPGWAQDDVGEDEPGRRRQQLQAIRALAPRVIAARAALSPYAATTRDRLGPAVAGARERVVPAFAGARETLVDTVAPAVAGALSTAVAAAREGKPNPAEARRRSAAALATLRGKPPRPQRRWPVALISLLAGAAAGAVAGLMVRRAAAPSEPTYIPAASPPPWSTQADEPVGTPSDLGWPEQSDEPFAGSDRDAVIAMDETDPTLTDPTLTDPTLTEVDLTLVEDSSETHKPTA